MSREAVAICKGVSRRQECNKSPSYLLSFSGFVFQEMLLRGKANNSKKIVSEFMNSPLEEFIFQVKCHKILNIGTYRFEQTVQIQMTLILNDQHDQGLHC